MDRSAFWSVVAQVAPVIALALVLEVRGFARRSARDAPDTKGGATRAVFVLFASVSALGLVIAFAVALTALANGSDFESMDSTVLAALGLAFGFVAINPILPVLGVLTRDVGSRIGAMTSNTFARIVTRRLDRQSAYVEGAMRDTRFRHRLKFAEEYTLAHRMLRLAKAHGADAQAHLASAHLDKLEAWHGEAEALFDTGEKNLREEIDRIRGMIAERSALRNSDSINAALEALGN